MTHDTIDKSEMAAMVHNENQPAHKDVAAFFYLAILTAVAFDNGFVV